MKNATEVERRNNVINLSFKDRRKNEESSVDDIPHEIAHPASVRYPVQDDPLEELLNEFNHLVDEDLIGELENEPSEEFIFNHQRNWDFEVTTQDEPKFMAETILDQIKRLKEDSKRLKYYLNEMNIDS